MYATDQNINTPLFYEWKWIFSRKQKKTFSADENEFLAQTFFFFF